MIPPMSVVKFALTFASVLCLRTPLRSCSIMSSYIPVTLVDQLQRQLGMIFKWYYIQPGVSEIQ